jgi:hypothetical protein
VHLHPRGAALDLEPHEAAVAEDQQDDEGVEAAARDNAGKRLAFARHVYIDGTFKADFLTIKPSASLSEIGSQPCRIRV